MNTHAQIPVTAVIVTRNEGVRIVECLQKLSAFSEIVVVDSNSADQTCATASEMGVRVENFAWNGQYPKKRQWCLNNLSFANDWIFFIDADEVVTPEFLDEIAAINFERTYAGFFISARYVFDGKLLKYGLRNKKLALIHKERMQFPVLDDADIKEMGEIEGHYQPVIRGGYEGYKIGHINSPIIHDAYDDLDKWEERHRRYARWESKMNDRNLWPPDPSPYRQALKRAFRRTFFRGCVAFLHSYILKMGILDGIQGYKFAQSRKRYYNMIKEEERVLRKESC